MSKWQDKANPFLNGTPLREEFKSFASHEPFHRWPYDVFSNPLK